MLSGRKIDKEICSWNEEGFPGRGHLRSKKLKGQKTVDRSTGR